MRKFRERLAFALAPWVRPMRVVERIAPYISNTRSVEDNGAVAREVIAHITRRSGRWTA